MSDPAACAAALAAPTEGARATPGEISAAMEAVFGRYGTQPMPMAGIYGGARDAGVQAIFGPGTNLVDAAGQVLQLLGHNLPPVGVE